MGLYGVPPLPGGEEKLFNRMEIRILVRSQWSRTIIQFVQKEGPKEDPANKQAIFLTNISKVK